MALPAAKETRIIEMSKRIEAYILGKLNQSEIDALWIEFVKAPEWLDYMLLELRLRSYLRANTHK